MKTVAFLFSAFAMSLVWASQIAAQSRNSEHTLRLDEAASSPAAEIEQMAWLAGYWRGEGLGGVSEEVWTRPSGDRMYGTFTLVREGKWVLSEAMLLVEEGGSLVLKVKHFTPDFVAWEEKDGYVSFPLVRLGETEAWFNGLTFRRSDESLAIYLVLVSQGEKTEHEFRLRRVPL